MRRLPRANLLEMCRQLMNLTQSVINQQKQQQQQQQQQQQYLIDVNIDGSFTQMRLSIASWLDDAVYTARQLFNLVFINLHQKKPFFPIHTTTTIRNVYQQQQQQQQYITQKKPIIHHRQLSRRCIENRRRRAANAADRCDRRRRSTKNARTRRSDCTIISTLIYKITHNKG
jgi:hypothetical protein